MSTKLSQQLRAESACIEEFLALLEREEQAMVNGTFSELPALTEQKARLQERVAELDSQREAAQVAQGFAAGRAGADAAALADGEDAMAAWADLLALAERAQAANSRNATLVFTHLDFTQNALRFLCASGQLFYGPDGTRRTPAGAGTRLALG